MSHRHAPLAIGLFSGGLDSILACKVLQDQGIEVRALKFVTPFFDHHLSADPAAYGRSIRRRYGIDVEVVDISPGYMDLLRAPRHGLGKHFNPCIDCKILMLRRARERMEALGGRFLFTGEVLGQRPMSQRRDTLRIIERDSGCEGLLLRPLCARRLPPTRIEEEGVVDRDRLLDLRGRSRKPQMALARRFGIQDYPSPAGGCILTDPTLGERIKAFYQGLFVNQELTVRDIHLLTTGRQFRLPGDIWFVLGRKQAENRRIQELAEPGDWRLRMEGRPGPTGLLPRMGPLAPDTVAGRATLLRLAGGMVVGYGKKIDGRIPPAPVLVEDGVRTERMEEVTPVPPPAAAQYMV